VKANRNEKELAPPRAGQPDFLDMDKRFTSIETKFAYLEQFAAELQSVCVEQGKMLDRLKAENRLIREKFSALEDSLSSVQSGIQGAMSANEKPPHY
jgi:uncharacterized coiled-coil protein SlyX